MTLKEDNVLTLLMYLFKYHMQDSCELTTAEKDIITELVEVGFPKTVIQKALKWLYKLREEDCNLITPPLDSIRVYSEYECEYLNMECRGFLMMLEQQGILTAITREIVINQVLFLDFEDVDIGLIKWVTLMVLFSQPGQDDALMHMEFLTLGDTLGGIH